MKDFKPKAWFLPQPVMIIGTYNEDGSPNAMNAAWGGQWDANEIMISMGSHMTTENLNRCAEFTLAFATKDSMIAANYVGIVSAKNNPDKIEKTGWKYSNGKNVEAPVFDIFPLTMECKIKEKLYESKTGYYIIAEIVNILCDEAYLSEDEKPDVEKMNLITFDPIHNGYISLGSRVGNAFHDGMAMK